jgi:hypothetical protein
MTEMTFQDLDRLEADRQVARRDCIERLARVLAKEFSLTELRLIQNDPGDAVRIEAYEIARSKVRG